ncbi:MAG: phosphoglycerate mutase family protein [Planctomycetota bacterium]
MRPRFLPAALSLALVAALVPLTSALRKPQPAPGPHTVILVRHAEKDSAKDKNDPPLTAGGTARAEELARLLAHAGVTRLVASEFRRTQATLAPLAKATGVTLEKRPAKELAALAEELRDAPAGSVTIVAGHSNTVPQLAEALGAPLPGIAKGANLGDDEYDRLFVLTVGLEPKPGAPAQGLAVELLYAPR